MRGSARAFTLALVTFVAIAVSCGGNAGSPPPVETPSPAPPAAPAPPTPPTTPTPPAAPTPPPAPSPPLPAGSYDVCHCTPTAPESADYRHAEKHIDLPVMVAQTITVDDILSWPQAAAPAADAPRSGRELQVFQIARAFLQNVYINPGDCDIHFEISATADANAPRVIVETPDDPSYCPARQNIQTQLAAQGLQFPLGGNVVPPLPVTVTGMAFQDFEHKRGSPLVATTWELHPAVVTIFPQ